jgi:myo-inositol-1(or 4)-monophosphatase
MDKQIEIVALNAAKQSGQMLKKEYAGFDRLDVRLKSHHEVLTKADLMSQEIIIREIKKYFPSHGIISEEQEQIKNYSDHTWYIDPIDGTTNFTMHNPLWSISMALAIKNQLVFGLIYVPLIEEIYLAQAGSGAYLNGKKIRVSNINQGKILNTFCHGSKDSDIKKALAYWRKQKLNELDCRQMGSAAIELAYVAAGRVESFVAPGTHDWDVAAGTLLIREAGGKVTDFKGRDWQLGNPNIAASNGKVHTQILRAIS